MNTRRHILHTLFRDSLGDWALAALVVVLLSGIAVALPYAPAAARTSVTEMMLYNPAAAYARNLHYWSAQLFLVLVLLHMWDEITRGGEKRLRTGVWWRLILSLPFLLFAMLSGFLLKGDADSLEARHILTDLLRRLPLAGDTLAAFFLGEGDTLLTVYLQHLATATLIILFVTFEHARRLWPKGRILLGVLLLTAVAALFFPAPLHDPHDPVLKGPWYFVGLQEVLHYMHRPGQIWWVLAALLLLLGLLRHWKGRLWRQMLAALLGVYLLLTVTGLFFRGEAWQWHLPFSRDGTGMGIRPTATLVRSLAAPPLTPPPGVAAARDEGCVACHGVTRGHAAAHDPAAIGCSSCHLGNPYTPDKKAAHRDMVLVPGNLADARRTCGTARCHPDIIPRVEQSLMATLSGMIAVDKYVFGERPDPDGYHHVDALKEKKRLTAAESHLQTLCVSCHTRRRKEAPARIAGDRRGGGCTACHLHYADTSWQQWQAYVAGGRHDTLLPRTHPSLSIAVTDDHCFSCHSRSGRISTNYEGWHETFLTAGEMPDSVHYRLLADGRVFVRRPDDVHHAAGMACIDCHNSYDVMGDGRPHLHEEEAVTVRCEDCHTRQERPRRARSRLDAGTSRLAGLRHYPDDSVVVGVRSANPLLNVFATNSGYVLRRQRDGAPLALRPPALRCRRDSVHGDLTCSACHTAWAPTCIGCHTTYEPGTPGYDMLHGDRPTRGTWVEYAGVMNADPPTLGVRLRNSQREIVPAIPGMVLTVDTASYPGGRRHDTLFHRLFAPAEPHTTARRGRSCRSCHNNPQALGYGKGILTYDTTGGTGHWTFSPHYAPLPYDSLPEDAWIPFGGTPPSPYYATRTNLRPFTPEEQQRILTAGACLTCHDEDSPVMLRSLYEWEKVLQERSPKCILPR